VAHLLEGSVRTQGQRVRITAQLIRATDGIHLWSKDFDGELTDVFKLQDQVARAIVDELKPMLVGTQKTRLVAQATDDPEAYACTCRPPSCSTSAITRSAGRGRLAGGSAAPGPEVHPRAVATGAGADGAQRLGPNHAAEAEKHARAAAAADPQLAQPHYVLGLVERYERHFLAARPYFDKAVALEPRDASTHMYLAQWLITMGYTREGIAELDRAMAIDPMLPNAVNWRAYQYMYAGDTESAQALFERTEALGLSLASRPGRSGAGARRHGRARCIGSRLRPGQCPLWRRRRWTSSRVRRHVRRRRCRAGALAPAARGLPARERGIARLRRGNFSAAGRRRAGAGADGPGAHHRRRRPGFRLFSPQWASCAHLPCFRPWREVAGSTVGRSTARPTCARARPRGLHMPVEKTGAN
jgi:Tfp pilus assembly protein PilF